MLRLLEYAVLRPWRKVVGQLPGNSDATELYRMFVLTVAAARGDKIPAVST